MKTIDEKDLLTSQINKETLQPAGRPGVPFVTCAVCHTGDLLARQRSSFKDWLAFLVGLKPYRCNRCHTRSYRKI